MSINKISIFLSFVIGIHSSIIHEDGGYWFPFPTVSMNYSKNCTLDLSYLNWKIEERIKIKGPHFYYKDKRVKFFGTNVAFEKAFPEKEDAPLIAKRMAQIGINVVRFHQMDNKDIWLNNSNSTFNKVKLDKLHYFLYCLKQNGIYANINLHVGRTYPEMLSNKTLKDAFVYGKGLDRFYPPFIKHQKNYARDLLTSFNNYTNFKIGDDPMILNVELNNEDSIIDLWGDEKFSLLTGEMQEELISQWRKFLKTKYKTYDEIYKFYNGQIINKDYNLLENNTIKSQNNNGIFNYDKEKDLVTFNITAVPTVSYGNQIHYGTINISNSTVYTVEFYARVKNPTKDTISFQFQENKSPYRTYLKTRTVNLYTNFLHYKLVAQTDDNCQITPGAKITPKIYLPPSVNFYEVKNLKLFIGQEEITISEKSEKSLDKILYPKNQLLNDIPNMAYDLRRFFSYLETNTQNTLTNYIKNELGFKNLYILDSQPSLGTFYSLERETELSDIIDIHNYWEHPIFPYNHMWDMDYYTIPNKPMIQSSGYGTFWSLTCGKYYNKPYTISEYNHPYPNEHSHEKFTMLGSWAAFHDFDALYQYTYDQSRNEYITGYFAMAPNPIDFAMAPYAALALRFSYVPKSKNYIKIKLNKGFINQKMKGTKTFSGLGLYSYYHPGWDAVFDFEIINNETSAEPFYENKNNVDIKSKTSLVSDIITWNNSNYKNDAFYKVSAEKYFTLTGFLGNSKMSINNNISNLINIRLKLNESLNETCTIGLVSLDNKKLEESEKLLLTIVGKARNTEQVWNAERTTTYKKGWGHAPTLAQYIQIECILKFKEGNKPKVYSINRFGELGKEFNLSGERNKWILKSDKNNPTLNYYIIRDINNSNIFNENSSTNTFIIIIVAFIVLLIIIGFIILYFCKNKFKKSNVNDLKEEPIIDDK